MRRVLRTAWILVFAGAVGELVIFLSISGALCLTAAGTVAIINLRWLEMVVENVVQPNRPSYNLKSILRIIGRFALLAGVLAAIAWLPQIDPVAVVVGFSAPVAALIVEGVRGGRFGGG
ncbi:MAG: ATP synthase subunit I [Thermoanaerobaculales bacterium]|nr:ATP synthase subunit I [Thermoanaerobaculales bacterium]